MPSYLTDRELPRAPHAVRRSWPDAVACQEALQHPAAHVGFEDLAAGRVARGRGGLPLAYSGRFAVVFRVAAPDGGDWALRCFTSPERMDERSLHWQGVARYAEALAPLLLPVRFRERGVRVDGEWYPAVAMPWASGEPLLAFVERRLGDPAALIRLADALERALARLEAFGVAHGDWQHDNMFVSDGGATVTLLDYDGFYAPEWWGASPGAGATEVGHPNYQHPGRGAGHHGVGIDRFACRVMRTGLLALARDPGLWRRYGDGDSLLFTRADLADPGRSPLFEELRRLAGDGDAGLAREAEALEAECVAPEPPLPAAPSVRPEVGVWSAGRSPGVSASAPWRLSPAGRTGAERAAASRGGTGAVTGPAPRAAPVTYAERLSRFEAAGAGRRNLARARVFLLTAAFALWATVAVTGWGFLSGVLAASGVYWFLVGSYLDWPRKQVCDQVHREMGRLTMEIGDLEARLAELRASRPPAGRAAGESEVRERTRASLRRVPLSRALAVPGVRRECVRRLRAGGFETAADLLPGVLPGGVGESEGARLLLWCRELERRFADEHRRALSPEHARAAEVGAAEREAADRRRRVRELVAECAALPASGLVDYAAALVTGRA